MAGPARPRSWQWPAGTGPAGRAGSRPAQRPARPVTWQQYEALLDSFTDRHGGRHLEQLSWVWRGPLDLHRFTASWQSVVDRETILRTGCALRPAPHLLLHARARADVVRHRAGSTGWPELLEADRRRGFDLARPAPLRLTLLDAPGAGAGPATRVLLTFHHALLDAWSALLLQQEFTRAYLAGGALPGGERRPDLGDWTCWLERQDPSAARAYWSGAAAPGRMALLPAVPGPNTGQSGNGRTETVLSRAEAGRLHRWAAAQAVSDSGVLHAVWALLLHRATTAGTPTTVRFAVTATGRGIALDAAERLVGPLRTLLPLTVRITPAHRLGRLLAALRDRALDMAAYEWASIGQVQQWAGHARTARVADSLVCLETLPRRPAALRAGLAAAGIRFEQQHTGGAHTGFPLALLARPGADGSLTLAVLHDRARIGDGDAGRLLAHCLRLLRHLPDTRPQATVADVLAVLGTEEVPRAAPAHRPPPPPARRLARPSTHGPASIEGGPSER
ncbi:condensation domain-containing protein [Streptomyces sp. NPDC101209]|uniref:condensation domain-containing protein n=1 Tax=Streptomyces sp. NPDC101209 TaxID=3366129 RepID=UPI0038074DDE